MYSLKTESGSVKTFKNASARLAGAISRLDPEAGVKVKITRSGEGYDVKWNVELV